MTPLRKYLIHPDLKHRSSPWLVEMFKCVFLDQLLNTLENTLFCILFYFIFNCVSMCGSVQVYAKAREHQKRVSKLRLQVESATDLDAGT